MIESSIFIQIDECYADMHIITVNIVSQSYGKKVKDISNR